LDKIRLKFTKRYGEKMRFQLLTVIWGNDFAKLFLELTLPSLLADGNVPALSHAHDVNFLIFTTETDQRYLEESSNFKKLTSIVSVKFVKFDLNEIDPSHFGSHWILWRRGKEIAKNENRAVILVMPDHIISDGTYEHWANLFESGYRAIFSPAPPVVLETTAAEFIQHDSTKGFKALSVSSGDLKEILLKHLHPVACCYDIKTRSFPPHAEYLIIPIEEEGLSLRVLTSQPMCFDPNHFDLAESFCPTNKIEDVTFDDCRIISLEPLMKNIGWYYRPSPLNDFSISCLGGWVDHFVSPSNCREWLHPYRLQISDTGPETVWEKAELDGDDLTGKFGAIHKFYKMRNYLKQNNLNSASQFLSAFMVFNLNASADFWHGNATFLVPSDPAFSMLSEENLHSILYSEDGENLLSFLQQHSFDSGIEIGPGYSINIENSENGIEMKSTSSAVNLDGQRVRINSPSETSTPKEASTVIEEIGTIDGIRVLKIDKVLYPKISQPAPTIVLATNVIGISRRIFRRLLRIWILGSFLRWLHFKITNFRFRRKSQLADQFPSISVPKANLKNSPLAKVSNKTAEELLRIGRYIRSLEIMRDILERHASFFSKSITSFPALERVRKLVAHARSKGLHPEVIFQAAATKDPKLPDPKFELGNLALDEERHLDALAWLSNITGSTRPLDIGSRRAQMHLRATAGTGRAYEKLGNKEAAILAYFAAQNDQSNVREIHTALARLYLESKSTSVEFLRYCDRAVTGGFDVLQKFDEPRDFAELESELYSWIEPLNLNGEG
jgi:uncharacterized surface protein with fasciclin (FAS1) repeats